MSSAVAGLRRVGGSPEVQACAAQPGLGGSLLAHGLFGALAALLGTRRPLLALALLLLAGWSAWRELHGRSGWLGRMAPRRVGHTVILWGTLPLQGRDRPLLLLHAPLDGGPARRPLGAGLAALAAAPAVLAMAGLLLRPLSLAGGHTLLLLGAAGLGLDALAGVLALLARPWDTRTGPAGLLLRSVHEALVGAPPQDLDLVLAWSSGGPRAAEGLETLLLNNRQRLAPERTRVVVLTPAPGGAAALSSEGHWARVQADSALLEAARAAGLPERSGLSAAARALAAGWPAMGIATGPEAVAGKLVDMIRALDQRARESRW